ncbi:MAG: hypothetical protein JO105_22700 [Hyphomicrobiales bacterium]|nr:hypothetical protein [Hyphomicrobiales bacterium]
MQDPCPPAWQRQRLLAFQHRLDAAHLQDGRQTLRRDTCGDYAIFGRLGHLYATPEGWHLCVATDGSPQRWTRVKKRLGFCRLAQDGSDEGVMVIDDRTHDRAISAGEAATIREALHIRQAKHFSAETLAAAAARLRAASNAA